MIFVNIKAVAAYTQSEKPFDGRSLLRGMLPDHQRAFLFGAVYG